MRKFLLTTVGVTALAVSANATDFTLSGSATLTIDDDGNTSMATDIELTASRTFDNGMTASFTVNVDGGAETDLNLSADAVSIEFSDFDQYAKSPGLNGGDGGADIASEGITTDDDNTGAIAVSLSLGTIDLGIATNDTGDSLISAATSFDLAGTTVTVGADMYEEDGNPADNMTSIGASASFGSLSVVVVQDQHDAASSASDETNYSAEYALGEIVLGAQGNDTASSISAAYTIAPGMTFEMGNEDDGTVDTATATLELVF